MAKGIGLIGNFKGKVGNMVGYKLTDSNSGNNQGIRVYQPIVKNPKTAAQAEQRAKLAPINATYRALKMVIDRGNEGLPYGNKSRLAWLKQAFKAEGMPWIEKGKIVGTPVLCMLTKGSLGNVEFTPYDDYIKIACDDVTSETPVSTVATLTAALLAGYPFLKEGDQITFVSVAKTPEGIMSVVRSVVLSATSTESVPYASVGVDELHIETGISSEICAVIISREGDNGEHLRSTTALKATTSISDAAPYDSASKTAAIETYMSSAAVNADWAEESIQ